MEVLKAGVVVMVVGRRRRVRVRRVVVGRRKFIVFVDGGFSWLRLRVGDMGKLIGEENEEEEEALVVENICCEEM